MLPFMSFFLICLLKDQRSPCEGDRVNVGDILHGEGVTGDRYANLLSTGL